MSTSQTQAWSALFLAHTEKSWDSLYRFALSLSQNKPEAEDLVQQTLLKALTHLPSFFSTNYQLEDAQEVAEFLRKSDTKTLEKHLLNWMMKIAKNTFLDGRQKSSQRLNHVPLDDWDESEPQSSPGQSLSSHPADSAAEKVQTLAQREEEFFKEALDDEWVEKFENLNSRQRSIIYLAAEEYSYKEIAQILDIPIGTVMSTLSRALAKLKK